MVLHYALFAQQVNLVKVWDLLNVIIAQQVLIQIKEPANVLFVKQEHTQKVGLLYAQYAQQENIL